jgi:hypothetical protein
VTAQPPASQPLPRQFTDSIGVIWTVREISPGPLPAKLQQLVGKDRRQGGWLLFMSERNERRRLAPVPSAWASLSDVELEGWCMRARAGPPAPERRPEDREPPA